jgi:curli biogenesis system outer membrane secretion channel CsgG
MRPNLNRGKSAHAMRILNRASALVFALGASVTPFGAASANAQAAADGRPSIVVMNFESGTVSAKVKDKHGFSAFLAAMRGENNNEHFDPAELGAGIADMLVEKILNLGEFRLMERKQLDATVREQGITAGNIIPAATSSTDPVVHASVLGARYMVTGSVTKFGFEEHQVGGALASMATFGMLSVKRHKTEVKLTARVIDVATGEIVAAFDGEGESDKGGGVSVMGIGANGGAGGSAENKNFKETAIGEATERAVQNLAEKLQAKRAMLASR